MLAPKRPQAVFIRLDKIGDLVCTLPVDEIAELQNWQIHWVIAKGLEALAEAAVPPRRFLELERNGRQSFFQLLRHLKEINPQLVVVFQAPWWVSLACYLARVPVRSTRLSQWHSYLFFNRSLRQSRSLAEKHEADYNLELLRFALKSDVKSDTPVLRLTTSVASISNLPSLPFLVVHPGMFGSALNWPPTKYSELIQILLAENKDASVVITGTLQDERFLTELKNSWSQNPRVLFLQNQLSLRELLFVLSKAKMVFAPSTGVLHLAASLGRVSVGLYSPVRVHLSKRWGPRGARALALTPKVECPATTECLGSSCKFFPCMASVSADSVFAAAQGLLESKIDPRKASE